MPTDQQKIEFANAVIKQLDDDDMVKKFQENVKQVGTWANQIDASFDRVTRKFADMVDDYGEDFPDLKDYSSEWTTYKRRWSKHLTLSRDVASEHVTILRRFDQVFLDMVESIKTDQDREDVIDELQDFIDEKHDKSIKMSKGFLTLKRDIEDFVRRLDKWIEDQGEELDEEAEQLRTEINDLQSEIEALDNKIRKATKAIAGSACLCIIGVKVPSRFKVASYMKERDEKARALEDKKDTLADVNDDQEGLTNLQSDFDGVKPDIALICHKLVLFAEIWSSIRSQTVQFQEHLKGGMQAVRNLRFKKEVRLARKMCGPLQAGLEKYASELENRK